MTAYLEPFQPSLFDRPHPARRDPIRLVVEAESACAYAVHLARALDVRLCPADVELQIISSDHCDECACACTCDCSHDCAVTSCDGCDCGACGGRTGCGCGCTDDSETVGIRAIAGDLDIARYVAADVASRHPDARKHDVVFYARGCEETIW